MIVSANRHWHHLDLVPEEALTDFMLDVTECSRILRDIPGVSRVNVAILGNREPHVHAHVIPRRAGEKNASKAPWDDPDPFHRLGDKQMLSMERYLIERLNASRRAL